ISFKVPPPGIFLCLIRSFGSSIPRNISSKLRLKSSNQLLVGNLQRLLNHSGNNSSSSNRFHLLVSVIIQGPAGSFEKGDRKSTRLNSSHVSISYAVFGLKKKK